MKAVHKIDFVFDSFAPLSDLKKVVLDHFHFREKSTGCMTRSWFFLYHSHDSYPKQSNEACPSDSEFCNICNILLYNQHFITDR